jgi:hypothetical protein
MRHTSQLGRYSFLALAVFVIKPTAAQPSIARPATASDPTAAIIDAFRSHSVVALAEGNHGNEQAHRFRLALVRDPRFAATVNDIVVEFGNARYQDLMDRFLRGDAVPDAALRQVWQNTTQAHTIWDVPIYEEFFRAVRAVNQPLARECQLRVVLGDPPIDWDLVHTREDFDKQMKELDRDRYPAELIRREVLRKGRRALIIYGDGHLARKHVLLNFEPSPFLLMQLERSGDATFTIWTETNIDLKNLQPDVAQWPKPSLASLRGTMLGAADFTSYIPPDTPRFANLGNGPDLFSPLPRAQWRTLRMEDQFDAVLYLGPPSDMTMSQLSVALCADRTYMEMRLERMTLAGMRRLVDRLKDYCTAALRK